MRKGARSRRGVRPDDFEALIDQIGGVLDRLDRQLRHCDRHGAQTRRRSRGLGHWYGCRWRGPLCGETLGDPGHAPALALEALDVCDAIDNFVGEIANARRRAVLW